MHTTWQRKRSGRGGGAVCKNGAWGMQRPYRRPPCRLAFSAARSCASGRLSPDREAPRAPVEEGCLVPPARACALCAHGERDVEVEARPRVIKGKKARHVKALAEARDIAADHLLAVALRELGLELVDLVHAHVAPLAHLHVLGVGDAPAAQRVVEAGEDVLGQVDALRDEVGVGEREGGRFGPRCGVMWRCVEGGKGG